MYINRHIIKKRISKKFSYYLQHYLHNNNRKIFCIGRNKTGTTSIEKSFRDLGFKVGNQRNAEMIYDKYYFENRFDKIINYCLSAQVFQDLPFSAPETYKHLDNAFPNSKYILTIRDNAEQWYDSLTRYHSKLFGKDGNLPTAEDLRNATYVRKGFMYNIIKLYGTSEDDPYNKEILIEHYNNYNYSVIKYFNERPNYLLVINIADKDSYKNFINFIGIKSPYSDFPWENKT